MGIDYNYYALLYAILAPKPCCIEKAFKSLELAGSKRKINIRDWADREVLKEMLNLRKEVGLVEAARLYCVPPSNLWHFIQRHRGEVEDEKTAI